ncbi:hypothetical protein M9H77_33797 [Catharanthus roseus]|uniref:Uncharacterized protein n=1 Tax=Catharanthus roseus TaxID=4058 RepID=A0ACB9ZNK6_CATRO|nr:hypothetical protein M9H77_33797 [Catharanthus roseus]
MGYGEQIDDLIESEIIRLLDWNDAMIDLQLGMSFVDKTQTISAVQKWSIWIEQEFRVVKSKSDQWTAKYYHTSDTNLSVVYPNQEEATHGRWEITKFTKKQHTLFNCGKWHEYILPYSHALVVYKDNSTRTDAYVPDIYSRETYKRTYPSNFYLVVHEDFWRDAAYNLTFYPPNMNNQWGQKQSTKFRAEMDYWNSDSSPRCSKCRMSEHNRKTSNNLYKFLFFKVW